MAKNTVSRTTQSTPRERRIERLSRLLARRVSPEKVARQLDITLVIGDFGGFPILVADDLVLVDAGPDELERAWLGVLTAIERRLDMPREAA